MKNWTGPGTFFLTFWYCFPLKHLRLLRESQYCIFLFYMVFTVPVFDAYKTKFTDETTAFEYEIETARWPT